ncbi:MAG: multicopper oxidase domain-containing protein [Piscinibacter sp.]|uniref:multicopper oxidase domain-containing protein n=1 Tax=Piscinibacter sp. TaxID=1903157 RepID=UPI0011D6646C|nr:multicopper oxidase domain-containing protein [Pseudomonadota bacterium]TXH55141.1 MAG: multicopper oxidase family protein [Burkholderiaceae bacterium]HRG71249.1 multicopper oxidase domain-containing protein [Thauera aminoaromatica]
MKLNKLLIAAASALTAQAAFAGVYPQCPFDITAASVTHETDAATGLTLHSRQVASSANAAGPHRQVCLHVVGGDGWMVLGNGAQTYGFGFAPAEGSDEQVMINGTSNAKFPAPSITLRQDDEVWLSLTNVGMIHRPDLFDQHSVHWHGFPQASAIFDGVPQASATVQMGSTFTYYYKVNDPGTYLWHCHVEATEHMEMGMIGMLNVLPRQDNTAYTDASVGKAFTKFAYNDGDGSTGYDKAFSLQLGAVDSNFHELHELVQPLPFLELKGDFAQINGRGYPMTTFENQADMSKADNSPSLSQQLHSVVRASVGERVLLRVTNGSVDSYFTLTGLGLPMKVVGRGAQIARGPSGAAADSWAHETASITLGGGDGIDVLIDTQGLAAGTYYLYTTNLNLLSNGASEDRGGLMTTFVLQ